MQSVNLPPCRCCGGHHGRLLFQSAMHLLLYRYCAGGGPSWSSSAAADVGQQEELMGALTRLVG